MRSLTAAMVFLLTFPSGIAHAELSGEVCGKDLDGDGMFDAEGEISQCIGSVCPYDTVQCDPSYAAPRCPAPGVLNPDRDMCQADPLSIDCPAGYTYDSSLDRCVRNVTCPDSGVFNSATDLCEKLVINECPSGYTYDSGRDLCYKPAACSEGGTYVAGRDRCEKATAPTCPSGYSYDATRRQCEKDPYCGTGGYSNAYDLCLSDYTVGCPSGYSYSSSRDRCEMSPVCPSGYSYNASQDKCISDTPSCPNGYSYTYSNGTGYCVGGVSCPSGYSYSSSSDVCVSDTPSCPGGFSYVGSPYDCVTSPACANGSYDAGRDQCVSSATQSIVQGTCVKVGVKFATRYKCYIDGEWTGYQDFDESICQANCNQTTYSCPAGTSLSGSECLSNPSCPSGSNFDGYHDVCHTSASYPTTGASCPSGGSLDTYYDVCLAPVTYASQNPTCPSGSMDYAGDVCYAAVVRNCPSGTTYDSALNKCSQSAYCSDSGVLDPAMDKCVIQSGIDCGTYAYDSGLNVCYSASQMCSAGAYNSSADECQASVTKECGSYSWSAASGKCELSPACDSPGTFAAPIDACVADPAHNCPTDYTWNSLPISRCEAVIICSAGTYDPAEDQCYLGDYSCPLGDYACADINGDGSNECSAFPCVDLATTPPEETPRDTSTYQDDGTVDPATGECSGVFKIFNGKGRECLKPGWSTTFFNCCDEDKGSFLFLKEVCPEESMETVQAVQAGRAHYIGEYCKKKIKFIGCIQKARMYCTFNSKMGLIIHEEGRPQLRKFAPEGGWGTAEAPNCEGFLPEEFQMLDFSGIDLSGLFGDIDPAATMDVQGDVQDSINRFYNDIR